MRFRVFPALLVSAFGLAPALLPCLAGAPAEKKPQPMIGSSVFKWDELKARITPNGERRDVANNPTPTLAVFESHITTLNPGRASHEPHRHPQEELILVKEGTLEVHIDGKTQNAGAGSVFFYAANDAHAVRNVGDTRATYWVINLATPTTHTAAAHNSSPSRPSGVFDWAKIAAQPTKTGERRDILKGSTRTMESLTCHATTVNVGEASHAAHRHPDDEIVIVKEGSLEVTINGRSERAGAGSVIFFASNDLHGMRNAGDTRVTYYVIRMITSATPKLAAAATAKPAAK
jgi:quercetin dioxygenase-like cupin family protein